MKNTLRKILRNPFEIRLITGVLYFLFIASLFFTIPVVIVYFLLFTVVPVSMLQQGESIADIWAHVLNILQELSWVSVLILGCSLALFVAIRKLRKYYHNVLAARRRAQYRGYGTARGRGQFAQRNKP